MLEAFLKYKLVFLVPQQNLLRYLKISGNLECYFFRFLFTLLNKI